jgi:hypothetical protein
MADVLTDIDPTSLNVREALKILCLYLAQKSEPIEPHLELGFETKKSAFEAISRKFGRNPNTIKNYRDKFDAYTDSDRAGWHQREAGEEDKSVLVRYGYMPRENLLDLARKILKFDWKIDTLSELPDLSEVIDDCRERLTRFNPSKPVRISDSLWASIRKAYLENTKSGKNDKVEIIDRNTLWITTPENKFLAISAQELPRCWAAIPYIGAIKKYETILEELALDLGYNSPRAAVARNEVFNKLPSKEWRTSADAEHRIEQDKIDAIDKFIFTRFANDPNSAERFKNFLEDSDWSGVKKELGRPDWIEAAVQAVGGWLAVGAARRGELVQALYLSPNIDADFESVINDTNITDNNLSISNLAVTGGENILFYGAPGTGKSYAANIEAGKDKDSIFRTLFHPDMQNSDFFGTLKPAVDINNQPTYKFREGPFAKALVYARKNPSRRVFLIIEELNRAMAAAVFGELFQLLDRNEDGASEYSVDAPSDEFAEWYGADKIKLPSNLWILATMNSADQGVYPLDTAFRRRWHQVYIPIDYSIAPKDNVRVSTLKNPDAMIPWPTFVEQLNKFLTEKIDIPEDRLVGPRFLKAAELEGGALPGKLLIYLWDDLLRHHGRHTLFTAILKSYGELHRANSERKPIFNQVFLDALELGPSETQAV